MSGVRSTHFWRLHQKCIARSCRNVPAERTSTLNNPIYFGESAVGRSAFPFSFIQRQHSKPSQPTLECLQVAKLSVA